ncbi:uncharacterized protein MELLADRAFT_123855 [Melampsora larici-populina 98AG31]|uniref:Secreted protein n=1 Tax=Melampsora larici-populina (strain 98AG31 / pathotype 3-4-7) TaxID=747676 RepID=F4S9U9_MELLP|nr:uncharacterized protein MELLADRAFT_123855 [Melampsora larici-populina 98AG31]EGF98580.1 secreted protein [Melampsora larici-populina 98AG31]
MSHFCAGRIFFLTSFIVSQVWSLGIPSTFTQEISGNHELTRRNNSGGGFVPKPYEDFQISDGIAGDSLEKSIKVFMEPFGLSLSSDLEIGPTDRLKSISQNDLKQLKIMARAASENENSGFVPALNKAAKDPKKHDELFVGLIANKVLKLIGQQTYLAIDFAQGKADRRQKLDEEKKKLKKNIELDKQNKGKKMVSYLHQD